MPPHTASQDKACIDQKGDIDASLKVLPIFLLSSKLFVVRQSSMKAFLELVPGLRQILSVAVKAYKTSNQLRDRRVSMLKGARRSRS